MTDYSFRLYEGASLVETEPLEKRVQHKGGGPRGKVVGFSPASRRRMLRSVGKVRRKVIVEGLFVTLTYPDIMRDGRKAKRDLRALEKRVCRAYPGVAGIWKMELQERGAIHFHLLILGVSFIPYEWLARVWFEIVGSGNPDHLVAGSQVDRVKSYRHAMAYVSKYLGKVEVESWEGIEQQGRIWGIFGEFDSFLGQVIEWVVDRVGLARVWRVFSNLWLSQARLHKADRRAGYIRRARRRRDRTLTAHSFFTDVDSLVARVGRIVGGS